jgi:aminoglycoside phosphotransferase (APT) family kinase protein
MKNQLLIDHEKKVVQSLVGLPDAGSIILNDAGWTSRVYVVNDGQFVVKFPRKAEVKKEYEQEIKILGLLERVNSHVQIPKIRWTHPQNNYIGYEGIIGHITLDQAGPLDLATKKRIGQDLGTFLRQLHSLDLSGGLGMTVQREIEQFQTKYHLGLPSIAQHFTPEVQDRLKQLVQIDMPNELRRLGADRVVCHGDLGYWNIILTADRSIGIIDFGDVGYYDKSKDFIGLEDAEMLDAALTVYGDNQALREKIAVRQKVLPLLDLAYYTEQHDQKGIVKTLGKLKSVL